MLSSITSDLFQEKVLTNEQPTVVEIYTQSCPNCKRLDPIFEQTATDNKDQYSFYKLDAQRNMDIAKRYKVLGVPTLLFFKHGILVDKKTGVINQEKIEKRLAKIAPYTKAQAAKKEIKGYFKMPWK